MEPINITVRNTAAGGHGTGEAAENSNLHPETGSGEHPGDGHEAFGSLKPTCADTPSPIRPNFFPSVLPTGGQIFKHEAT